MNQLKSLKWFKYGLNTLNYIDYFIADKYLNQHMWRNK